MPAPEVAPTVAPQPAADTTDLLVATITIDDTKIYLLGRPRHDASRVALRFERAVRAPELSKCKQLALLLDQLPSQHPLQHKVESDEAGLREIVQTHLSIEHIDRVKRAKDVSFDLCGMKRELSVAQHPDIERFASDFRARSGKAEVAAPRVSNDSPRR